MPGGLTVVLTGCALLGSTVSGIVGMAGGALLLGLMLIAGLEPAVAVPVHAVVQLVSNSSRVVAHLRHVRWKTFCSFALPAAPCPLLGMWLLAGLDGNTLRALMGAVILVAVWAPKRGLERVPDRTAFMVAGVIGGTLGVVVGAVGPLIAAFFLRPSFDRHAIIGTKAVCQAYLHVLKIIAFGAAGFAFASELDLILPMAAAAVCGAWIGKWILAWISEAQFVWLYKSILTLLALRLVAAPLWRMGA